MLDDDLDDSLPPPPPPQPQPQQQQQQLQPKRPLLPHEHLPPPPPPPPPSAAAVAAALSAADASVALVRALKAELVVKPGVDQKAKMMRADRWIQFIDMPPTEKRELQFKLDDEYMKDWVLDGYVHCAAGCGKYENSDGNFKRHHLGKLTHMTKVQQGARQLSLQEASSASAAAAVARSADIRAALLMHGLPHATFTNVGKLYEEDALRMATYLSRKDGGGNPLKPGKQVETASERADELLFEETKTLMAGLSGALIIDEANIKFDMKQKVLGIVFEATVLDGPVLLEIIFDVEDGWEDDPIDKEGNKWSDKAAAAVLKALEKHGKSINEITTMVADNAVAMAALARKLGVPLMNCIPHSLQVAYTYFTKHFKRYTIAIYNLSAFIKAGGGSARIKDLERAGISARKLLAKATRWRQGHEVAKFLLNVEAGATDERIMFERVRAVMQSSINFKVGSEYKEAKKQKAAEAAAAAAAAAPAASDAAAGDADADSVEEEDEEIDENEALVICAVPGAVRTKAPVKKISQELQQVYETNKKDDEPRLFLGLLELYIVDYFANDLLELITAMSANVNKINLSGLTDCIAALRRRLDLGKMPAMHNIPFQTIFAKAAFSCSAAEQARYVDKFSPIIVAACTDALAKFDVLVPKAIDQLVHRLRYEPTNPPKPFPAVPKRGLGHRFDADDVRSFFGTVPGDVDLEVMDDWSIYVEKWPSIPDKIKNLGIGPFWEHPEVLELFPDKKAEKLRRYAHWWGAQPTSSVAMERVFAIMRSMEGSQRMALSREKINLELKIKCNPWIAERVLKRTAAALPPLK